VATIQHKAVGCAHPTLDSHAEASPNFYHSSKGRSSASNSDQGHFSQESNTETTNHSLDLGISPINVPLLKILLLEYPNAVDAQILSAGFEYGFKIEYKGPRSHFECRNLRSAYDNKKQLFDKMNKEISLGRIAGPFSSPPFANLHVSPVGVVPKSDGGWRMITHLSFPSGSSINDGIDPDISSVHYTSFDQVTDMIYSLGPSALIAKRDLKSAYRILPIRIEDFSLLGIKIDNKYYVDKFLPMGLSQSASLFEKFSTFLHWLVVTKAHVSTMAHLLDDFLMAGPNGQDACHILVEIFENSCKELGVPIAEEKSVNPTTIMTYLGFEIDTNRMTVCIPCHKLHELKALITAFLNRKKISLRDLQRLVGKLNFFGKAIRSSRAFLRRFYDAMMPLKKPYHMLRITRELREDLKVWLVFLQDFNGVAYIPEQIWVSNTVIQLYTDAAGGASNGAACFFQGQWCFFPWLHEWIEQGVLRDMTFLEMVPVLLAIYLWSNRLIKQKISIFIDNEALVQVLNKQTSKSKRLMQLVRPFVLKCMSNNILFHAIHIPSKANVIADSISRRQWGKFRQVAPDAERDPLPIPAGFLFLISTLRLDDW
jgi:hypothetical protein